MAAVQIDTYDRTKRAHDGGIKRAPRLPV
jgi:hypothetical protein